jgi:hypothetical protein
MFARTALALLLTALPALADDPLNADAFGAYVTGKTITYDYGGGISGIEQYLPGNQVRWAFEGDTCLNGKWYQVADQICFIYENDATPQCWHFYREGTGLSATYLGDDLGTVINEVAQSAKPLACTGPDVGV